MRDELELKESNRVKGLLKAKLLEHFEMKMKAKVRERRAKSIQKIKTKSRPEVDYQ